MLLKQYKIGLRKCCHQSNTHPKLVFIKGRYIGETIRIIQKCIEHLNDKNKPRLFFLADFEKAYYSIDHSYMYKSFIKWVKLFYSGCNSKILNNGNMSDSFLIEKAVRQGCLLSMSLFFCCIELLSNYIITSKEIIGVKIAEEETKQTTLFDVNYFVAVMLQAQIE